MIRVLIVARSPVMQIGLEALISHEPGIDVIGRAADLRTLEPSFRTLKADVLLVEFALLTDTQLDLLATLSDAVAIALLVTPHDSYPAADLLQAGIRGILPMDVTAHEMVVAVEAIATGLVVLHPDVTADLLKGGTAPHEPDVSADAPLTPREIEVLQLLATGLGNKAIARQLNISEHTVKFHISSIFSKLNATSRTEAVTLGMRQGLVFI